MKCKKLLVFIVIIVLGVSMVQALPKPVGSHIAFTSEVEQVFVTIIVETELPWGGNTQCETVPAIKNGPDGSFSSNLANLKVKDFYSVDCSSFWKQGDSIWYEVELNGKIYQSNKETIKPGTVTQILSSLEIVEEGIQVSPVEEGGSGEEGTIIKEKESDDSEIELKPEITALLSLEEQERVINATVLLELLNAIESPVSLKLVLFSLPDNLVIKTIEDDFILSNSVEKQYSLGELDPGWYKVQVLVYVDEELQEVSNTKEIFVKEVQLGEEAVEEEVSTSPLLQKAFAGAPWWPVYLLLLITIVLLVVVIYLYLKKKRKNKR